MEKSLAKQQYIWLYLPLRERWIKVKNIRLTFKIFDYTFIKANEID